MNAIRILVAEDDAVVATLLTAVLEDMGHTVCAVEATQASAVAAATRTRPDLMIVDEKLGSGSGVAAVAEILQSGLVPHIFASGSELRGQSINPHAVVLQKPYSAGDLTSAIARALAATANPAAG
jgi:CheY-like chemotaxis protein